MSDTIDIEIVEQSIELSITQGVAGASDLTLGETSTTAYRGDRGKTAYDHSQATHAPADAQKNSDITKAEIEAKLTGEITSHTHTASQVASVGFQAPSFANPLNLDSTTYKDFKVTITGDTTVNLNNTVDGDAGMIELIISGAGGYTVSLGTMFTKKLGTTSIVATTGADNFISWRMVGTDIVYTINQVE